MKWNRWYVTKSYFNSALWIVPLIALVFENIAIRLLIAVHEWLEWVPWFGTTLGGATETLNTIEALNVSFIVFTFSSMLVAIQVASGQLTPRIIATALLRNNVIRFTVGLFTFTMLFAVGTGARIGTTIPQYAVTTAWVLGIISIAAFLFLIDYTARLLRPISIVWRIAEQGTEVIKNVCPEFSGKSLAHGKRRPSASPTRIVEYRGRSGVILAANMTSLFSMAERIDGVIELLPRIGDFLPAGEPLFRLHGNATHIPDSHLEAQVAFGRERTIEQDSTFAFRVIVDIAIKALSPAINDPTTAVIAIDQLQRLLRLVGGRHLNDGALCSRDGRLRLLFPVPSWDDFVQLAISEIRLYGAANFQVARRLRAMIEYLVEGLPESRRPTLRQQLDMLDRMLQKFNYLPEDVMLSSQPDFQGLGGTAPST